MARWKGSIAVLLCLALLQTGYPAFAEPQKPPDSKGIGMKGGSSLNLAGRAGGQPGATFDGSRKTQGGGASAPVPNRLEGSCPNCNGKSKRISPDTGNVPAPGQGKASARGNLAAEGEANAKEEKKEEGPDYPGIFGAVALGALGGAAIGAIIGGLALGPVGLVAGALLGAMLGGAAAGAYKAYKDKK